MSRGLRAPRRNGSTPRGAENVLKEKWHAGSLWMRRARIRGATACYGRGSVQNMPFLNAF